MVGVSASVNLTLHHKVQKFSSGTGSSGWSQRKGRKMVVWYSIMRMGPTEHKSTSWTNPSAFMLNNSDQN